jgi:hypothetical protein
MNFRSTLRTLPLATLFLLAASHAQNATPSVLRWNYGAPNTVTDTTHAAKVEGLKTDDVHIYVALYDIKDTEYNRAWVQIVNHGQTPIQFDPQAAALRGGRTVPAEGPEKAANSIQRLGEAKSQELSSAHCGMMASSAPSSSMACEPTETQMQMSKQVLIVSGTEAQWIRDKALKQTTLAPGEEAIGAIVFRKDKRPADYLLVIPVGGETFEFPVSARNQAPSYD